jgi:hypothetical protein
VSHQLISRNLAIDGGHELCAEMYNKGIMAHLEVLIKKVSFGHSPNNNSGPEAKAYRQISGTVDAVVTSPSATTASLSDAELQNRKHLLSLTENVISLLWSLAETSHKTLAAVNAVGCEALLVKVLAGRDLLGMGVAIASGKLVAFPNSHRFGTRS